MLCLQVGSDLSLSSVSVCQQLLLVVQQLFSGLGGVFDVGCLQKRRCLAQVGNKAIWATPYFDNSIDGTSFLAETTVDTLEEYHGPVSLQDEDKLLQSRTASHLP